MTRVAARTVEQVPAEENAPANSCRHDHADVVAHAGGRALPSFAAGEGLGVVVDQHRQSTVLGKSCAQGEVAPRGDIQWRHRFTVRGHRPAAAHADGSRTLDRVPEAVDRGSQGGEQSAGIHRSGCGDDAPVEDPARRVDDTDSQLGAADVDGDDRVHLAERTCIVCATGWRRRCG